MDRAALRVMPPRAMTEEASESMQRLLRTIPVLTDLVQRLMSEVVIREDANESDVYLSVVRLEAVLESLLGDDRYVRSLNSVGSDAELQTLLAGCYRHLLVDIRAWLRELVETLTDPVAACRRRGLPTTGQVELRLPLTLTAPPEAAQLTHLIQDQARRTARSGSTGRTGRGFWGTVGAVVLGWWIGSSLFGGDD